LPAIQRDTPSRWSLQWMPCTYVPRSSTKKRFSVPCMHAAWLASSFQFCTDTEAQCTFSVDYRVPYTILVETGRQGSHCTQTTSDACMHGFISSMNWERRMRFIYYLRLLEWVTEWVCAHPSCSRWCIYVDNLPMWDAQRRPYLPTPMRPATGWTKTPDARLIYYVLPLSKKI
jgi:hypothetical protein